MKTEEETDAGAERRDDGFRTLVVALRAVGEPVEIACADVAVRDKVAELARSRAKLYAYASEYEDSGWGLPFRLFGKSEFHVVLGETDLVGEPTWHGMRLSVAVDGEKVFDHLVSPDETHGVVFERTESPFGAGSGAGADERIVGAVRWRTYGWIPRTLRVPPDFRFDPGKLVVPVFRFAIDWDGAEPTTLVRQDEIRYDGRLLETLDAPPPTPYKGRSEHFVFLDRNGLRPCPELMDGWDWAVFLARRPEFADACEWEKLDAPAWARLLVVRPQFADRCRKWDSFRGHGRDLARLLSKRPQFADLCDFSKLDLYDWKSLLEKLPWYAGRCRDLSLFDGVIWTMLLSKSPNLSDWCDWEKLNGLEWAELLSDRPQFANRCDWEKLNGHDWAKLLSNRPQFADRCDWKKLDGSGWAELLSNQPQFSTRCDWKKLRGRDWAVFLACRPAFADRCDWDSLDGEAWGLLLSKQPQFADRCDWDAMDGEAWGLLLSEQPQFADRCDWDKLNQSGGAAFERLLTKRPQFADRCDWSKLYEDYLWPLIRRQPQLAAYAPPPTP